MPIYAYKCDSCGHAKDVLQKISDAPLSVCPECGAATFKKQLTSAGFHLKGSGWYVTDFRDGAKTAPSGGSTESEKKPDTGSQVQKPEASKSPADQNATPAIAAAPSSTPTPSASAAESTPPPKAVA